MAHGTLRGLSLVLVSLMVFIAAGITLFGKLAVWGLAASGVDLTRPVSGIGVLIAFPCAVIAMIAAFYVSVAVWLLCARICFTRAQVLAVCCWKTHTAFDLWLVDLYFPKEP